MNGLNRVIIELLTPQHQENYLIPLTKLTATEQYFITRAVWNEWRSVTYNDSQFDDHMQQLTVAL